MKTCTLKSILQAVLALGGLSYARSVTAEQRLQLVTLCGEAVREAWQAVPWWETELTEERYYKPAWDSGAGYVVGNIVHAADANGNQVYWESIQNGGNHAPVSSPTFWKAASGFDAYVLLAATGETEMGTVTDAFDADPNLPGSMATRVGYHLRNDRVQFLPGQAPDPTVWIVFQSVAAKLNGEAWDPAVDYITGQVVYYHGDGVTAGHGECYVALVDVPGDPDNDTPRISDSWAAVVLPYHLQSVIVYGTRAHALRADGQEDKAQAAEGDRTRAFENAVVRDTVQQQQNGRYRPRRR